MKRYKSFASSTIGADHIRRNVCCQDAVGKYEDDRMSIVAIADGHGSPQYFRSESGAKYAVDAAIECVKNFVDNVSIDEDNSAESILTHPKNRDIVMKDLQKSILVAWHKSIEQDYQENPFTDDEVKDLPDKYKERYASGAFESAYGATIIVAVVTSEFWLALQIGDGHCVIVNNEEKVYHPVPEDIECYDNITTSICQKTAQDSFRYYFDTDIPIAIFLASDGVEDSYDYDEMLYALYRGIVVVFGKDFESGVKEIDEFLPVITQKGKGDDTSMAGIIDTEKIKCCANRFRKRITDEKFKAAIEKLKTKLEQKKKQFEDNSLVIGDLEQKISALEQMRADSTVEIERKTKEISDIETKIAALEKDKQEIVEQIEIKRGLGEKIRGEVNQIELDIEVEIKNYEEQQREENDSTNANFSEMPPDSDISEAKGFMNFISKFLSAPNSNSEEDCVEQCESTPEA